MSQTTARKCTLGKVILSLFTLGLTSIGSPYTLANEVDKRVRDNSVKIGQFIKQHKELTGKLIGQSSLQKSNKPVSMYGCDKLLSPYIFSQKGPGKVEVALPRVAFLSEANLATEDDEKIGIAFINGLVEKILPGSCKKLMVCENPHSLELAGNLLAFFMLDVAPEFWPIYPSIQQLVIDRIYPKVKTLCRCV